MRICELCGARYKGAPAICPLDGGRLRELPDPLLGRSIAGRYHILERVGAGGMGTVYRARDEARVADVAIKFLLSDLAADPTNRQRFLREAKAANRIDHENIIDVHDFGETDDGQVFLAMEFLQGIALAQEIDRGVMGVVRAVDIAMQCASALARAHELDVVHRDIKPENIYLVAHPERHDFVKVLDFGLAHMKGELRLTASGAVFGTPEYMAPEQARGAPLTGQADLYALGCVLFEMITGAPPFRGPTPDLILKHMREPAPLPSSRVADVPPALDQLTKKLLEKDPQKRHRDGYHLLEELRRIADQLPQPRPSSRVRDTLRDASTHDAARAAPSEPTGPVLPEGWESRVMLFRRLAPLAYPHETPPAWLIAAIEGLAARVNATRVLESELARATEQAKQREEHARGVRLSMGRAIDELGRDESRAVRRQVELAVALDEARASLVDLEPPLAAALRGLGGTTMVLSRESALRVRDAGALASAWLEAHVQVTALTREIAVLEGERDDLRFQISQLKGRLGTAGAEEDLELGAMREEAARLGRQRETLTDELHLEAMTILRHFAQFPALGEAVRSATLPPEDEGKTVARRP